MASSTKYTSTKYQSSNKRALDEYMLGIDVGTTTVKTALVNYNSKETVARQGVEHYAYIESDIAGSCHREQNVDKILLALNKCISLLPEKTLRNVKEIVVCGQMHGCVLWVKEKLANFTGELSTETKLQQIGNFASSLITWEDGRCSIEFLGSLPKGNGTPPLASGFGCASLFWLQCHTPEVLKQYDCAGTIMDLVVACLCSNTVVYMSSQNAYSWGCFNVENGSWDSGLTPELFPTYLLPVVSEPGHIAGQLTKCWYGIPSGATVRVALGDMQCSILATMAQLGDAVLNIGTSIQLSIIVKERIEDIPVFNEVMTNPAMNIVPYFENFHLIVAASLTGGNALACFVKMLQSWISDLGLQEPSTEVIYQKLSECEVKDGNVRLNVSPVLWGERHNPRQTASITDITQGSLSLGNVYRSLCQGLLVNVHSMMSNKILQMCNIQKITGTGNALVQNPTLQQSVRDVFNCPLTLCQDADAAIGAALSAIEHNIYSVIK